MRSFTSLLRCIAVAAVLSLASEASLTPAQQKISMIERGRWPASGSIAFTPRELLALGMSQINAAAPGAVLNPTLHLGQNGATATALVDFDLLKNANRSGQSNGLLSRLISGQQSVSVSVGITSAHGKMTVHPTAVSVSGYSVTGPALNFLVQNFLVSPYPETVIDRPFALPPGVSRVEVNTKSALVYRR